MATRVVRMTLEELANRPPLTPELADLMRRLLPPVKSGEAQPESTRRAS